VSIEPVDLGLCPGYEYAGDPGRTAVVLPGAILGGMPVAAFAIAPLTARGWRVVQLWDTWDRETDPVAWATARTEAALGYAGTTHLVIAKSITTLAAGVAADLALPAAWLTPLVLDAACADGLRARSARALAIGGSADPAWNGALARELADEVVELEDADHGLARLDDLRRVADAVGAFADALRAPLARPPRGP
jgi:hypothetical protein